MTDIEQQRINEEDESVKLEDINRHEKECHGIFLSMMIVYPTFGTILFWIMYVIFVLHSDNAQHTFFSLLIVHYILLVMTCIYFIARYNKNVYIEEKDGQIITLSLSTFRRYNLIKWIAYSYTFLVVMIPVTCLVVFYHST